MRRRKRRSLSKRRRRSIRTRSRRRARLIMGALGVACVLLFGWIIYRAFLYDPVGLDVSSSAGATATPTGPEVRPSLDQEARFMFDRAHEFAKNGRTDQAVAMLNRVLKVYKGTPAAREAQGGTRSCREEAAAIQRSARCRRRERTTQTRARSGSASGRRRRLPAQPQAAQGQVALVLPANPAEGGRRATHVRSRNRNDRGRHHSAGTPSGVPGQSRRRCPRVRLAAGDRGRSRRFPDGPGSRRHLYDGQQRGSARGSAGASGAFVDLLHRPARSHEPPVPHLPGRVSLPWQARRASG